jgi:hypothetical protein
MAGELAGELWEGAAEDEGSVLGRGIAGEFRVASEGFEL